MKPVDPETTATEKRVSPSQLPGEGPHGEASGGRGSGGDLGEGACIVVSRGGSGEAG